MATFDELKQRYMLTSIGGGGSSGSATQIPVFAGCEVLPLIDGADYFRDLKTEINRLGGAPATGQFIYIAGWWCGRTFSLDGQSGAAALADLLIQKSRAGVDVRVLGWVMAPEVMQSSQIQGHVGLLEMLGLNGDTMNFVRRLQSEPTLANKAVLNILSHPAGAAHMKMALVGTATQAVGFTGGLDLESTRFDTRWHDVQTNVTGPATQTFFDTFRSMWNEVRGRSPVALTAPEGRAAGAPMITVTSHTSSMPDLPARTVASTSPARMHVQGVRTLPMFNFAGGMASLGSLPKNAALSYAPSGLFEVRAVWEKAIKAAQHYIFVEDQAFFSREVFEWINSMVKANAALKVVLITGQPDFNDAPNSQLAKFFTAAVNSTLVAGLSTAQRDRIALLSDRKRMVHSKTSIVDDQWAIIGSANSMRRSLYTDFEHSVAFMDEAGRGVPQYREKLWGSFFNASMPDMNAALAEWFTIPYKGAGSGPAHLSGLERLRLPMSAVTLTADDQVLLDEVFDCDSRQAWGDDLVDLYMRQSGAGGLSP